MKAQSLIPKYDDCYYDNLVKIIHGDQYDPHTVLGLHYFSKDKKVIRLWRPGAKKLFLKVFSEIVQATKIHEAGFFEYIVPINAMVDDYLVYHQNGLLAHDPYSFLPTVGEVDLYLFGKGVHYKLFRAMGGRLSEQQGILGVKFSVWAPSAVRVSLVADFNNWDGRVNPMRSLGQSGIWEIFIPGLSEGEKYKFEIKTQKGEITLKSDPFAYSAELRPATASIISHVDRFKWTDSQWIENRIQHKNQPQPITTYEVHLGSWKKDKEAFKNYRQLGKELAVYCKSMGFTHIELMPIQEHPLDESWGYQVSGFFAVTSRYGSPEDFQWFVNHMHEAGIGVILDWVPGHFPVDAFSLGRFDGTSLYEHEDSRQGFHPHWGTYIFNFGRFEVANFLIANALFWFDVMHIDGLRVDAVASMLYLDYGRDSGDWIPNQYGRKENIEAIEFFKHLNSSVHQHFPGVLMIAEESTSFAGITHPLEEGGLGFNLKWNMGWMNDTLRYFSKDMLFRSHHHHDLTFGLLYAFTEKFMLVLSHDEVVHGKKNLISKMPGDLWQKFANLRLLLSYMICQPGKKLLFMGGEIGQFDEWNCKGEVDWSLLEYSTHLGVQTMVKELNHLYLENKSFWEYDFDYRGFEWVNFSDADNSVVSYLRKGSTSRFLCIHNFTPNYYSEYYFALTSFVQAKEIFNSDNEIYGGSGKVNQHLLVHKGNEGFVCGLSIQLAPLATMIFKLS